MNMTSRPTLQDIPRQRWLRIIPPILIACIISYMDRVNIAFAMPGGMDEELGISATMAGLAGGIFFIGYLFLQVPGGKIAVHGSGKKFIGWSLVALGGHFRFDGVDHESVSTAGFALLTRRCRRRHAAGRADDDQ